MSQQPGRKPQDSGEYKVIGTRPPRADAVDKVTGRAQFGPDIALPGMLHGKILRSPHAHARLRAIDTSRAEALPGVYAVVTARDLPRPEGAEAESEELDLTFARENVFASRKVLYVGHAVAAVAAASPHIAEEALALIAVDYEVLPAVVDVRAAMQLGAPLLQDDSITSDGTGGSRASSNVADRIGKQAGDAERALVQADVVVEREFTTCTVHQGYIEPHASTAVWSPDGLLTVWTTTQGAFAIRDQLHSLLDYPMSSIRVIPTEVGGAFGGKNVGYTDLAAALLARVSGRPVRIVMGRAEVFLGTGPSSGCWMHVKAGATRDGKLTAAEARLCYEAGFYPGSPVGSAVELLFGCYNIPNLCLKGYDVLVNKPHTGSYRAPGGTPAVFAGEQVIDELAQTLGLDPLEFRLRNALRADSVRPDGSTPGPIGCQAVLEAARASAHYRAPLPGPHCGRGVALATWGNWGAQSSVTISVNGDGTVSLLMGSVDLSGTRTTTAMQAAEILDLRVEDVRATVGDTATIGFTEVSAGSRTTFATGLAAIKAAEEVLAKMRARAASFWQVPEESVVYKDGRFATHAEPSYGLSWTQLAAALASTGGPITGVGNVDAQGWGPSYGVHIADVAVDPETGKVDILRYTVIQDVGKAIHPTLVEGQLQGGATQGIGWALYEGYQYAPDGRPLNPNLLDYKLPTALDVPRIETVLVEVPGPNHPFGVRGVGECPILPPAAALANAIYRAVGVRLDRLPMTPARILEKMGVI